MNIKQLMQRMHDAQTEEETGKIKREIISQYSSLSDAEKETVKKDFLNGLDKKLKDADQLIEKIDIALTISEISKYVSLSKIASGYFGKSKEWLYQRIKGYSVNGKPVAFTEDERKKPAAAFEDISRPAHETSLRIA